MYYDELFIINNQNISSYTSVSCNFANTIGLFCMDVSSSSSDKHTIIMQRIIYRRKFTKNIYGIIYGRVFIYSSCKYFVDMSNII